MKYHHIVFLILICLLLVSPVLADNVTKPSASTLKPFLTCGVGLTSQNSCTLPSGKYPSFESFGGTTSRTWDGTSAGLGLAGVYFEVQYDSITDFTMTTYSNQVITGQIVVTQGILYSTRTLTLNGISKTYQGIDVFASTRPEYHKFFISLYALNITTSEWGIVLYNAGLLEATKTGDVAHGYTGLYGEGSNQVISSLSEENVFVTIDQLTPIRTITFSSTKPDTIAFWYADAGTISSSMSAVQSPGGVAGITAEAFSSLTSRLITGAWDSYLSLTDLFIELLLNIPLIFVLYEICVSVIAFFYCRGNLFKGIKQWWSYQMAFVRFIFFGIDLFMEHWQVFAVAALVVMFGRFVSVFYDWVHFVTLGAI